MKIRIIFLLVSASFLTYACGKTGQQKIEELEKQELATGIRHDSLFQGLYLGMTQPDFRDTCRVRHAQKLFDESSNRMVEFELKKGEVKFPMKLTFNTTFEQDKITQMVAYFKYSTPEPWNPEKTTAKLSKDVRLLMEKWYGGSFFITQLTAETKAFLQISGNRRIIISVEKEDEVMVVFTDLSAKNK